MAKKKRIFVGYQLSESLKEEIVKWREKHVLPVRWVPLENLHVTLVPPWYEENVDEVIRRLKSAKYPVSKIILLFETVSLGPEQNRPWLLWAKGEMSAKLFTLQLHLIDILQRRVEARGPLLHTTIARFDKKQFELFPDKYFSENIRWKDTITSFSLIESHLRRTGAEYETLAKMRL